MKNETFEVLKIFRERVNILSFHLALDNFKNGWNWAIDDSVSIIDRTIDHYKEDIMENETFEVLKNLRNDIDNAFYNNKLFNNKLLITGIIEFIKGYDEAINEVLSMIDTLTRS